MRTHQLPKRVYWRRNCYQYKATDLDRLHGMTAWVRLSPDPDEAIDAYYQLKRIASSDQKTLGWLLDWYLKEIACDLRPRTRLDKAAHVRHIKNRIGGAVVSLIRPSDIQKYVFARSKESPNQAKQELSTISQAFRWGRRFGYVSENPANDIATPRITSRDLYVTDSELRLFVAVNPEWGGSVALLGYALGQRLSDFLALRYASDALELQTQKTMRKARIEMTPELETLIRRLNPSVRAGDLIIANRFGAPFDRSSFHQRWQPCMRCFEHAGGKRFHFHDLKAKFVTDSEAVGLDPQKQALHDNRKTTEIYLRNRGFEKVVSLAYRML